MNDKIYFINLDYLNLNVKLKVNFGVLYDSRGDETPFYIDINNSIKTIINNDFHSLLSGPRNERTYTIPGVDIFEDIIDKYYKQLLITISKYCNGCINALLDYNKFIIHKCDINNYIANVHNTETNLIIYYIHSIEVVNDEHNTLNMIDANNKVQLQLYNIYIDLKVTLKFLNNRINNKQIDVVKHYTVIADNHNITYTLDYKLIFKLTNWLTRYNIFKPTDLEYIKKFCKPGKQIYLLKLFNLFNIANNMRVINPFFILNNISEPLHNIPLIKSINSIKNNNIIKRILNNDTYTYICNEFNTLLETDRILKQNYIESSYNIDPTKLHGVSMVPYNKGKFIYNKLTLSNIDNLSLLDIKFKSKYVILYISNIKDVTSNK